MPATPSGSTIFTFTPCQVLLSNQTMKHSVENGTLTLKPEQKLLLHQSIVHYLQHNGFSKTLKKFCFEAQIEKDNLDGSSIDLEEMCLKYLKICGKDAKSNNNDEKDQATDVSKNKEEGKPKEEKKKSKIVSESHATDVEDNQLELPTLITEKKVKDDVSADAKVVNGAETEKKSKDKKKKKDKTSSQGDAVKQIEDPNGTVSKKDKAVNKEVREDEKKDAKKRKRQSSEENGQKFADRKEDEETKRRKVEYLNESEGGEQSAKINANLGSDGDQLQKTPNKQANGKTNGHLESAGEKPSEQKSQKSQEKGSVEQKSAKKAFQRVQADKVEFADERLQDNTYWAKDGAESGYGAKALEIIGQVRGRVGAVHTSGRKAHVDVVLELETQFGRSVDPGDLFLVTHRRNTGQWVDTRSQHTYESYHAHLEEVASQAESTPGSQPVDVAQKMQIWRDVSGGVTRGRCYGTADLLANVRHQAPTLTQESVAPSHHRSRSDNSSDGLVARAEAARAREEATNQRLEAANQQLKEAYQQFWEVNQQLWEANQQLWEVNQQLKEVNRRYEDMMHQLLARVSPLKHFGPSAPSQPPAP